jgi:hypothetical protein
MLNGFHTNAACVNNTAGTFAQYLLGYDFGSFTLPAMKVRQAWALMAEDLEPAGRVYVSLGAVRTGDLAWNFDDYFWGEGGVGPDISKSQTLGFWTYKATV